MIERLLYLLEQEAAKNEDYLLSGVISSMEMYRGIVSQIKAYRHAIEIVKQSFNEDDDEEQL